MGVTESHGVSRNGTMGTWQEGGPEKSDTITVFGPKGRSFSLYTRPWTMNGHRALLSAAREPDMHSTGKIGDHAYQFPHARKRNWPLPSIFMVSRKVTPCRISMPEQHDRLDETPGL